MACTVYITKYRAVSCVFQNIDPPPPSLPGECILPPHPRRGGGTHSPGDEGGWGVNILEDVRHTIGLLQYNRSTVYIIHHVYIMPRESFLTLVKSYTYVLLKLLTTEIKLIGYFCNFAIN